MKNKIDEHGKCPECGESWDGGNIFDTHRKQDWTNKMSDKELMNHIKSSYSEPYKWSKLVGIEIKEKYDGISYWQCPFCKVTWDRWTEELVKNQ